LDDWDAEDGRGRPGDHVSATIPITWMFSTATDKQARTIEIDTPSLLMKIGTYKSETAADA
jgi:hypothetical protein